MDDFEKARVLLVDRPVGFGGGDQLRRHPGGVGDLLDCQLGAPGGGERCPSVAFGDRAVRSINSS